MKQVHLDLDVKPYQTKIIEQWKSTDNKTYYITYWPKDDKNTRTPDSTTIAMWIVKYKKS